MAPGSPNDALAALLAGNQRFAAGVSVRPRQSVERRVEVAGAQQPFAAIIACSDSRMPPEIIFDCGLGDLFVIRVAGNVLDDVGLGSIEFAVVTLGVGLVLVLGHSRCGAVIAAIEGSEPPGHIRSVVERIRPALAQARAAGGDLVDATIRANIAMGVAALRASQPILAQRVADGRLQVAGARYDLDTGLVHLLDN